MSARSALDGARPVLARLDVSRGRDATKADLIEAWRAIEEALRALVGNTGASGQSLIRDARARQLLTFDQANALVAFLTVRENIDRPEYQASESDVHAARAAFLKLDAGLGNTPAAAVEPAEPAPVVAPPRAAPPGAAPPLRNVKRSRSYAIPIVIVLTLGIGAALYAAFRPRSDSAMTTAIRAYLAGDKLTASSYFEQAARANPKDPMPHVYLARMAREVGNFPVANQELQLALKINPASLEGRREYGSLFLSEGNYDQARIWYTHALEVNGSDSASAGWLGCVLVKLGRSEEAVRWLARAGSNPVWSTCRAAVAITPPAIRP